MRTPNNNLLKSAMMTLALATASFFALNATAAEEVNTNTTVSPKVPMAAENNPVPLPRPEPPIVSDAFQRADLNHDGHYTMDDLVLLLSAWGNCPAATDAVCNADISQDHIVNEADLMFLLRLINQEAASQE